MAVSGLAVPPTHTDVFRRRILLNARYWHAYVSGKAADVPALDMERELIIKAIVFALELREAWPIVSELLLTFAPYMERRGHWEISHQLLNRAVKIAHEIEDVSAVIALSALLARLLQRQSQVKQAASHYRQVIRQARHSKNLYEEARACTNLGYLYVEEGHWHRAEVLCCHALTIFETINSDHGRAHTENHLGFLYTRQSIWDRAKHHLEQACAIWRSMGDNHGLMRGFINLGSLYNERECPDLALSALEKARQCAELAGEEAEIGTVYLNIGVAYRLKGEPVQAEACAWRAEEVFRRFSNSSYLTLVWINLGAAYTDQGRWQEAEKYLGLALEGCQTLKNEYGEIKALMGIVEYELARQNYQQAAKRLSKLEDFIQRPDKILRYRYLQPHLAKYRHSLDRSLKKTSEVLETSEVVSD